MEGPFVKTISKVFLQGLAAVLPVALTVYVVYWLGARGEEVFRGLITGVLGEDIYFTGLGLLASAAVVLLVGLLMYHRLARWLYDLGAGLIERIPVIKAVYGMIADIMRFFAHSEREAFSQVVMVETGVGEMELMGFITRTSFEGVAKGIGGAGQVAVYLPMSYQLGGFVVMVPRSRLRPVEMGMQDAMRFVVTAGMSKPVAS